MIEIAAILSAAITHWDDFAILLLLLVTNAVVGFLSSLDDMTLYCHNPVINQIGLSSYPQDQHRALRTLHDRKCRTAFQEFL
jgi:hypothetical protein